MAGAYHTSNSFLRPLRRMSKLVLASYVLDWLVMVAILGIAGGFHYIEAKGSRHAFSLQDPNISYPLIDDLVSNGVLYVASVIIPAIIIAGICLVIIPGPDSGRRTSSSTRRMWQRKIWELNAGWLGLALSALGAIAITNGLKALAGKPRPHLLTLCDPDLSPASIARWRVGGLGDLSSSSSNSITALATAPIMVTWEICRNNNDDEMKNAFASWPSGHASTSWSGLLYLTLWFMAKFGVSFPAPGLRWMIGGGRHSHDGASSSSALRKEGAAPPAYLVLLSAVPIGTAFFISISRWFDYRHHGFDIISGAILGIFCAWVSFRLYQTPFSVGDGWAWAPRTRSTAFGRLVGRDTEMLAPTSRSMGFDHTQQNFAMGKVRAGNDLESQPTDGIQTSNGYNLRPTGSIRVNDR